ncbi:hypothetical protein FE257_008618 [Aspergillus nanangensis]|uniref:Uncharacterized protein n=1 Tax=Aspergillus nanangensis TaxID=2582783 RepID=A0AAD4CL97_ASPNN|nr:hypothetical protein FE257_008618 [Aspergillus nanangensis]
MVVYTEIEIEVPPAVAREAFFNFPAIPNYHTAFLTQITPKNPSKQGPPEVGDILTVTAGGMTFSPVVEVSSSEEFTWRGTLGSTWIFSGAHSFKFLPVDGSTQKTRLVHSEEFQGALVPLFGLIGGGSTGKNFQKFNEDFKTYVEARK